jgi:hypothetical protein
MIKATINGKDYQVPTSWDDVPYRIGAEVVRLTEPDEALCMLIGLDTETLNALKESSVSQLFHCIKFIEDITIMDSDVPLEKYAKFDYGSAPYGDTQKVKQILSNNLDKSFSQLAPEIIKRLTGDEIGDLPFSEIIGTVGFFLNQWIAWSVHSKSSETQKGQVTRKWPESKDSNDSETLVLG